MYLIKFLVEFDDETGQNLYWSNADGWVSRETATTFSREEIRNARLIGKWEEEELF
jgi:hypothetical protein